MHKQRLTVLILSVCGMIGPFLPMAYIPLIGAMPGTAGGGWLYIFCFLPAFCCALSGDKNLPIEGLARWVSALPPFCVSLLAMLGLINFEIKMSGLRGDDNFFVDVVSLGPSLFVTAISGFALNIFIWSMDKKKLDEDLKK